MVFKVEIGDRVVIDGETLVFTGSSVEAYAACIEAAAAGGEVDNMTVSLIRRSDHCPQIVSFGRLCQAVEEQLKEE